RSTARGRRGRDAGAPGSVYNGASTDPEADMRTISRLIPVLALAASTAWAQATVHQHYAKDARTSEPAADGRMGPSLQSLGTHKFPVTTKSAEAQKFVDQGMNLSYGFNHA